MCAIYKKIVLPHAEGKKFCMMTLIRPGHLPTASADSLECLDTRVKISMRASTVLGAGLIISSRYLAYFCQ